MVASEVKVKMTSKQLADRHGFSVAELCRRTGLRPGSVRRAISGDGQMLNVGTAELIARQLGYDIGEIAWPCGLTDQGRPPLTGGKYTVTAPIPVQPTCTECFTLLSVSGECSHCAA